MLLLSPVVYRFLLGLVYVAGYVLLDRLSFLYPFASFGVTPWNPPAGVGFALVLIMGRRYIPWLFVAPLVADVVVRGMPFSPPVEAFTVLAMGGGYGVVLWHLTRPGLKFSAELATTRDLILFLGHAFAGAFLVSLMFTLVLCLSGNIAWADFYTVSERYWIGDVIGVVVLTPFLMVLAKAHRLVPSWLDTLAGLVAVSAALWVIFGLTDARQLHLFYVLFIPILWMALRGGLESVTIGNLFAQVGLILAVQMANETDVRVTALQFLMLALSITGLATGTLVDERQDFQSRLRLHQDALARVARLGSVSEVGAVLAHELNQPLTAIGNYIDLVSSSVTSDDPQTALHAAQKAGEQIERAAEVVRKLRDFIRLGRSEIAPVRLDTIVSDVIEVCQPAAKKANVALSAKIPATTPPLMADLLQIEQVLQNLVTNSIEAITGAGQRNGTVVISGAPVSDDGYVEVTVRDNGPGFSREVRDIVFLPFVSEKKSGGSGLGLSLSRTLIESHGGSLWIGSESGGASVHFKLPIARTDDVQ